MMVNSDSIFELQPEDESTPQHSLRPVPIKELPELLAKQKMGEQQQGGAGGGMQMGFSVDVIGVVMQAQPMTGRTQSTHTRRREGEGNQPGEHAHYCLVLCLQRS